MASPNPSSAYSSALLVATAGALSSAVSTAILYPVDLIKVRLQAQLKKTTSQEKSRNNYLPSSAPSHNCDSVDTTGHGGDTAHHLSYRNSHSRHTSDCAHSDEASPCSKSQDDDIQQKFLVYGGFRDAMFKILSKEGVGGLYIGLWSNIFRQAWQNFCLFYFRRALFNIHDLWIHKVDIKVKIGPRSIFWDLILGMLAANLNMLLNSPLEVIGMRLQIRSTSYPSSVSHKNCQYEAQKYPTWLSCAREIYSESGISGFYTALFPTLLLGLNPSVHLAVFDRIKKWILQVTKASSLTSFQSFMAGNLAKLIAIGATYPLIRTKTVLIGNAKEIKLAKNRKNSLQSRNDSVDEGYVGSPKELSGSTFQTATCDGAIISLKSASILNKKVTKALSATTSVTKEDLDFGEGFCEIYHVLAHIYEKEGILGLYFGCKAQMSKAMLGAGLHLAVNERIMEYISSW
eukprot:UC4_evm4s754